MAKKTEKIKITETKRIDLENELFELKTRLSEEIIPAIQEARSQGDLSENADYSASREEQGRVNARIQEIQEILKNHVLADQSSAGTDNFNRVITIKLNGIEQTYKLLNSFETDPSNGVLGIDSPIGKVLLDAHEGDQLNVKTDSGRVVSVEVLQIV
jgi:transcription elongation factor GreA